MIRRQALLAASLVVVAVALSTADRRPAPIPSQREPLLLVTDRDCARTRSIDWTGGFATPEAALEAAFPGIVAERVVAGPGEIRFVVRDGERTVAAYRALLGVRGWTVAEGIELIPCTTFTDTTRV